MDNWIPFQQVDFSDENLKTFHIDTRDFHCSQSSKETELLGLDLEVLKNSKHSTFFHTPQEVVELLGRYFTESGGKGEWRMFNLKGSKVEPDWSIKYIRIYRTEYGLIVCNSRNYVLNKEILSYPVDQEHLNHY